MGPVLALLAAATVATVPQASPPPPPGEQPTAAYVQSNANAGATPVAGRDTFQAFPGLPGVQRIAARFVDLDTRDPRIKEIFAEADTVRLKRVLAEQFCYLLNGGCAYTGRDMRAAHAGQGLQTSDFNAVVENLQTAMDAEGVPFHAQNLLLAKLAPMQRSVVERRSPPALTHLSRRLASLWGGR